MNDQKSFEYFLTERFDEFGPGRPMSNEVRDDLRAVARETRQRPRWLALIKEPPMRTDSHLAVGSPTARVAAVVVATMLLVTLVAGAGFAGARLLADDAAIVVAQDGSGDYATISDAVAAADDGETVLVRPGTYIEAVAIDDDIMLAGDGPVEAVIIEAPEGGPTVATGADRGSRPAAYALLLRDSDSSVSGLTFRGEQSRVHASGGAPVLEGLVLEGVDIPHTASYGDYGSVAITGGSTATIRDCTFEGGNGVFVYDGSAPVITSNTFRSGASIGEGIGAGTVIRGNEIIGASFAAVGFSRPTATLIEDNVISGSPNGIWIGGSSSGDLGPTIRANSISDVGTGIRVGFGAVPTIERNTLTASDRAGISLSDGAGGASISNNAFRDNEIGIGIGRTDAVIKGNTIEGGAVGVVLTRGATAALTDNTIDGARTFGITIGPGANPTLTDNRVCNNGTNLDVREGAEPIVRDNDICPDPTTPTDA